MLTNLNQDTTTQMVETIWPLSAYVQTNHSVLCSRQPSKMDLRYFIQEVLRRSKTSYSTLQVALYYLILIRSCLPTLDFTMEQPEDSPRSFSLQCGRRMFISALILASKYLQDRNFSANAWSKISGLSTWDLNVNEMAFLSTINWKLHIPGQVFDRWVDIVLKYSPSSPPRSSPKPTISWKDVVLRLTPDLDTIDFGGAELSDDSGYDSPGSDMSPPPIPIRDEIVSRSNEPTPTPSCSIPQWLEQTPSRVQEQRPTLPPLQPHLAPLPTPDLTPQIGPFSTPAVSAQGMSTRRSSMSQTMRQIQEASLARSTLDHTSEWKPRVSHGFPTLDRRTSLTTSASSMSSPESMSDVLTQFSDASSRPSRSSSISSVASSNCAPPQPTRLAVQATRRCANMQLNGLTEEVHQSGNREPPKRVSSMEFVCKPGADALRVTKPSPKESDHIFQEDKRTRPLGNAMREASHMIGEDAVKLNPAATRQTGRSESFNGDCFTTYQRQKHLRKLPHSFAAPATADNEAAAALQELALNYQQGSTARPRSTDSSRKRARPNSMDLSVEDAVRNLIAPRCLNDITNQQRINRNEKDSTVIADDCCADSFVLRKENKHASKEAHKRSTKAAPLSRDGQPRKRPCAVAGSNRGGREEARLLERMVAQRSGRSTGMREAGIR